MKDEKKIGLSASQTYLNAWSFFAEALENDDLQKARGHPEKAKQTIDSDPDLTIRKKWERLAQGFK